MAEKNRSRTYGMGRIYQRGRIWWVRYYRNGQEFNKSSRSEKEADAKRLLKKRMGEIALSRFAGPKAEKVTFAELTQDFLTDYRIKERDKQNKIGFKLKPLLAAFGNDRAKSVTTDRIKHYIEQRQQEGAATSTINRELSVLKRAFNLALQAEKLVSKPYIPMLTESNVRTGFFEPEEFLAVRDALPSFLQPVATFGYYTGWRVTEVLTLQWRQVDLDAAEVRLDPGSTKNKDGRVIYLDGELLDVMQEQRAFVLSVQRERGEIIPWVFINPETGDRIRNFRKSWDKACQQTGLIGRLFHDFRRTAVRNMVRAGVSEVAAMKISGHRTRSIFDRYNIVSEQDLREAARRMSTPPAKDRDKTGTIAPLTTPRFSRKFRK
ncbi:MAG: tyrosine-type recombinase/integrase [Candidatus Binatia bacterium]